MPPINNDGDRLHRRPRAGSLAIHEPYQGVLESGRQGAAGLLGTQGVVAGERGGDGLVRAWIRRPRLKGCERFLLGVRLTGEVEARQRLTRVPNRQRPHIDNALKR